MTNYEWLKMQPVELIVHAIAVEGCQYCIKKEICNGNVNVNAIDCEAGVLAWLQQEHEEPPKMVNRNELIEDIEKGEYCTKEYCESYTGFICDTKHADCPEAIINYIKAMEGEEIEQPTTYNVENIIEQIRISSDKGIFKPCDFTGLIGSISYKGSFINTGKAIDIVKRGGIDD